MYFSAPNTHTYTHTQTLSTIRKLERAEIQDEEGSHRSTNHLCKLALAIAGSNTTSISITIFTFMENPHTRLYRKSSHY